MNKETLLNNQLSKKKLRLTKQRSVIVKAFLEMEPHVTAEELHQKMLRQKQTVGLATIYRTLNLLSLWGLVQQRQFGEGPALYELHETLHRHHHHDHLICTGCGTIIEFKEPRIETLQDEVAKQYQFTVNYHKHELYGLCTTCKEGA